MIFRSQSGWFWVSHHCFHISVSFTLLATADYWNLLVRSCPFFFLLVRSFLWCTTCRRGGTCPRCLHLDIPAFQRSFYFGAHRSFVYWKTMEPMRWSRQQKPQHSRALFPKHYKAYLFYVQKEVEATLLFHTGFSQAASDIIFYICCKQAVGPF